ncbi:hypothetical protein EXIGLDRAFT_771141 [Exidia glandulosa HHB12029]|uniref:Roadblock/LAMTOR2 domain-containing protein n=1 Tax=Exidia glandulosa HHB12029 TaxID=1314781 RepID=A0A165G7X3_EXIGL|nr:hypothetical protein EXIGLDRAFT_771141 [Exidia glandulosa HHB12029]
MAAPSTSLTPPVAASSAAPIALPPPELEQNLALLTAHRSVLGVMILSHTPASAALHNPASTSIIRHSGVVFEGELGRKYAGAVARIVAACHLGLEEIGGDGDDIRFMRIRTKRHELMISPHDEYILVLLHDPSA